MTSAAVQTAAGGRDLDKPLYTIGIAADILTTTTQTLMMYEHFGLVVPPRSGRSNRRLFSQRDLLAIRAIERLMRSRGLNMAGARCVIECIQLLDAHGIPRPASLADVDVNHLKV
jgi:DNA-binding transcriptional MerR regulator